MSVKSFLILEGGRMDFGEHLAEVRKAQGLSQLALADAVGTSQSAISQLEAGERNPSYEMIRELAKALKVTAAYLIGAEVEELSPEEEAHFREYRGLSKQAKQDLKDFMAYLKVRHKVTRPAEKK